jgi:hypothetical protein
MHSKRELSAEGTERLPGRRPGLLAGVANLLGDKGRALRASALFAFRDVPALMDVESSRELQSSHRGILAFQGDTMRSPHLT